jgi:hypothetical protein
MTIKDTGDGYLVLLSKPMDSRPKLLHFFWFILFFFTGGRFIHEAIHGESAGPVVFACAVSVLFFVLSYRFINKAYLSEQLFIGRGELRLIKKNFTTRVRVFSMADVSQFRHLGKTPATEHPLKGQTFDALGFQTQQELIKDLGGNGRMAFDYQGRVVVFGENVYSWEFERLAALVAAAGGDVRMLPSGEDRVSVETVVEGADQEFRLPGEPEPVVWMAPRSESAAADVYFMPESAPGSAGEPTPPAAADDSLPPAADSV